VGLVAGWKQRARQLKTDAYALYLACRDPRVPWYVKLLAGCVVAYAFSPIDLIPDFVPVLGYLDDLVLVPLGVALVIKLIPVSIMEECRIEAKVAIDRPTNWAAAVVVIAMWLLIAALAIAFVVRIQESLTQV